VVDGVPTGDGPLEPGTVGDRVALGNGCALAVFPPWRPCGPTRSRLPGFKVPVAWEFVDSMPRNPNGKILRRVLGARAAPDAGG
jgi:acyl-CoA synthetase (AMP-forming)/AMP-acid ligase II